MVSLDDFVKEEIARILAFQKYWKKEQGINPDGFPIEMREGDWVEQLNIWEQP
jgi:hypothetical protein